MSERIIDSPRDFGMSAGQKYEPNEAEIAAKKYALLLEIQKLDKKPAVITNSPSFNPENSIVGVKYDQDKPNMSLLSSVAINELTRVLDFGAKKYADHNWRKGIHSSRLLAAALRHLFAYLGGESKDPETGLSHVAHAMCCCMFIIELAVTKPELDDRYGVSAVSSSNNIVRNTNAAPSSTN